MSIRTLEEVHRAGMVKIIDEVLGKDKISLNLDRFTFFYDEEKKLNFIKASWHQVEADKKSKPAYEVESHGDGAVDALWNLLTGHYSAKYKTIKDIKFKNFYVKPFFKKSKGSGADAKVEVVMEFKTSTKNNVTFRDTSKSFVLSVAKIIFSAIEFYINGELAFKRLKFLLKEARDRNRGDLVSDYSYKMAAIVDATSYIEVARSG